MSERQKHSATLLITQCVIVVVCLAAVGVLRLLGGSLYAEWKSGWQYLTEENAWVDSGTEWLAGEMDGKSEEVTS